MTDDFENSIQAVENDEYAEFPLGEGYILITDWEGDGYFLPYVQPPEDVENPAELEQEVDDLLLDYIACDGVEWSEGNGVFYPTVPSVIEG